MGVVGAENFEILCEAGFAEHAGGVFADRFDPADFECVFVVEPENGGGTGDSAFVACGLAVVFALGVEFGDFEQAVGYGREFGSADAFFQLGVLDGDGRAFDDAWFEEAGLFGHLYEVGFVECAAQAFGKEQWVGSGVFGKASVAEYVAEIKFAAVFEDAGGFSEHAVFAWAQVDDAV